MNNALTGPSKCHRRNHLIQLGALTFLLYLAAHVALEESPALCSSKLQLFDGYSGVENQMVGPRAEVQSSLTPFSNSATASGPVNMNDWTNSLGMVFVPLDRSKVQFCIWETRVRDFRAFINDLDHQGDYNYRKGSPPFVLKSGEWKQWGQEYGWDNPGFQQTEDHPVTCVSREDAMAFCRWLTQKERQENRIRTNQSYRLPTDAQWSLAVGWNQSSSHSVNPENARITSVYPWGTQWPPPAGSGNYSGSEARDGDWPQDFDGTVKGYNDGYARTSPVGRFPANVFGLHDLGGNVWEWCSDGILRQDESADHRGRKWPPSHLENGLLRGGSWFSSQNEMESTKRISDSPSLRCADYGFRCVLEDE